MAKIIKDIYIRWDWEGDIETVRGFNVAVTPEGGDPNTEATIKESTGKGKTRILPNPDDYPDLNNYHEHIFRDVTIESEIDYTAWVQTVYESEDSDWVDMSGVIATDDGFSTVASIKHVDFVTAGVSARNGFEDSELGDWTNDSGSTMSQFKDEAFSNNYSGLFTSTNSNPSPSGTTEEAAWTIKDERALSFAGKRIDITFYAKQPPSNASSEFAVCYSTNDTGNSDWHRFSPTNVWTQYSFKYNVPLPDEGGADFLAIWGDTSGSGKGVLIDNVVVQVETTHDFAKSPGTAGEGKIHLNEGGIYHGTDAANYNYILKPNGEAGFDEGRVVITEAKGLEIPGGRFDLSTEDETNGVHINNQGIKGMTGGLINYHMDNSGQILDSQNYPLVNIEGDAPYRVVAAGVNAGGSSFQNLFLAAVDIHVPPGRIMFLEIHPIAEWKTYSFYDIETVMECYGYFNTGSGDYIYLSGGAEGSSYANVNVYGNYSITNTEGTERFNSRFAWKLIDAAETLSVTQAEKGYTGTPTNSSSTTKTISDVNITSGGTIVSK